MPPDAQVAAAAGAGKAPGGGRHGGGGGGSAKKAKRGGHDAAPATPKAGGGGHHAHHGHAHTPGPALDDDHDLVELRSALDGVMEAVVKVFATHSEPNYSLPWQKKRQYQSTSTGFAIAKNRVITNAHAVEHHTQVRVKRRGSDTKYVARVLAIGTECDLALLEVNDKEFWNDLPCIKMGPLPQLQDAVTVVGYPIGGDTISVTQGVVSRIEVTSYVHGSTELLGVQIDAAINSGNSGGPSFYDDGTCAGVAFQSLKSDDAENIGYIIPTPVVEHFIRDFETSGRFTGFPQLGIEWQKMESPALREAMGMKAAQKGVMVRRLEPTGSAATSAREPGAPPIAPKSILLDFDGVKIACDGTVPFRRGERIAFSYLVSQKMVGDKAKLRILCDDAAPSAGAKAKRVERTLEVTLRCSDRIVPPHSSRYATPTQGPSYLIVAGLVFTVATVPYLKSEYGKEYDYDAPVKLLDRLMHGMAETEGEQIVVLAHVLACPACVGYEDLVNTVVLTFNGKPLKSLRQLRDDIATCKEPYFKFGLDYHQMVVLERQAATASTAEVLKTHAIPAPMSADLATPVKTEDAAAVPPPETKRAKRR